MRRDEPDDIVLIYTTVGSLVEAETIGEQLVGARAAACVNITPGMLSIYRWQGKVDRGHEATMIVKTTRARVETCRRLVREAHSYDTPAFVVLESSGGDPAYLAWLREQVS